MGFEVELRNVDGSTTARGIDLTRVVVKVDGDYDGQPADSTGISYAIDIEGRATDHELQALVDHVDSIAEVPNSLRGGTEVRLTTARLKAATVLS